jgi:UDP-glucose 4-epimerase
MLSDMLSTLLQQVGESKEKPYNYYDTDIGSTIWVVGLPTDNFIFASTSCATQCASPYVVSKLVAD